MPTPQTADVHVTNATDGTAHLQLFHENDAQGAHNASWTAAPGETVGPMTVEFETGPGSEGILDWWTVIAAVEGGSAPGIYQNTGTPHLPNRLDCKLQSADAGNDLAFSVSASTFDVKLVSGAGSDGMARLSDFSKITNVFVLMLENHSFDNILGQSGIDGITHATSADSNTYNGVAYPVGSPALSAMPSDPGHEFQDVVEQLCGATYPPGGPYPPITNAGYAANYATSTTEGNAPPAKDIGNIMLGFDTANQLPVIYALATEFAICDNWFSSMPGPTWPNRFFLHGASSSGLDHSPSNLEIFKWETYTGFTYPNGSIFQALTNAGLGWRLYNDRNGPLSGSIPQVTSLQGIFQSQTIPLTDLAGDLQRPYSAQYTLIEPNYGEMTDNSYRGGSSQHPMDGVRGGENLINEVYRAIRNSPAWNTSLLIVTYDEHGGFYDSAIPPAAPPPDDGSPNTLNQWGFTFDQYGPRVPAVVASPLIAKGTVDGTLYDHSSVPATLEQLFGFGALTKRDAAANSVLGLLTEPSPRTDAPMTLYTPISQAPAVRAATPTPAELAALAVQDAEPLDTSGNLVGFLGAALSTEVELSGTNEARRAAIIAEYEAISTQGEARARLAMVVAKADAARASARSGTVGPARTPGVGT